MGGQAMSNNKKGYPYVMSSPSVTYRISYKLGKKELTTPDFLQVQVTEVGDLREFFL